MMFTIKNDSICRCPNMMSVIGRIDCVVGQNLTSGDTFEKFTVGIDGDLAIFQFVFSELETENICLVHALMAKSIPALCTITTEYVTALPNKKVGLTILVDYWKSALER